MKLENDQIQKVWQDRQQCLGNTLRAVLFKNFPGILNRYIHRQHLKFILEELQYDYRKVLDVGCGYGRISMEIMKERSEISIEGVELVTSFAEHFSKTIGRCYNVSLQEINLMKKFDAILLVTVLMYLEKKDILPVLSNLWENLRPGGRIICIEPVNNVLISTRKFFDMRKFEPTAGSGVSYFSKSYLLEVLTDLPGASFESTASIGVLPLVKFPELHIAISISKDGK